MKNISYVTTFLAYTCSLQIAQNTVTYGN